MQEVNRNVFYLLQINYLSFIKIGNVNLLYFVTNLLI